MKVPEKYVSDLNKFVWLGKILLRSESNKNSSTKLQVASSRSRFRALKKLVILMGFLLKKVLKML